MKKATATYVAPQGDNKVVEMGGVTFFDGKSVELNSFDNEHLISKLANNQHFDIEVGEDDGKVVKRKPGRPPKPKLAETKPGETGTVAPKPAAAPAVPPPPPATPPVD